MPIEIKELHIHVELNASPDRLAPAGQQGGSGRGTQSDEQDAIIAECVEQVLQILQSKKER